MEVSETSSTNNGGADVYNTLAERLERDMHKLGLTVLGEYPCDRHLRHAHTLLCCYFFHSGCPSEHSHQQG